MYSDVHELSLCEGVLQILESEAEKQHFRKVKTVRLEIGALSGVEISAMEFCFEAVMRHSLAEGARMEIVQMPGVAWCSQCARSVVVEQRFDACPVCESYPLQITGGGEMKIKELEVE